MGRREDKKRDTRQRLRTAAFELFDERGYDATKVEDVARAAGVSPRTVYRYFPTKADLVFAESSADLARIVELVAGRPKREGPFAAVRNALVDIAPDLDEPITVDRARIIAANPTLYRHALEVRDQWAVAIGEALVARGGRGGSDADRRLLGHVALAAFLVAAREWRDAGRDREALPRFMARTLDAMPRLVTMDR